MTLPRRIQTKANRTERWKSPAHCNFVRKHHCCAPGCMAMPIEVAHLRAGTDGGTGKKPSDFHTISLCRDHHAEQHRMGEGPFQEKHKLNFDELAMEFCRASPKWPEIRNIMRERGWNV